MAHDVSKSKLIVLASSDLESLAKKLAISDLSLRVPDLEVNGNSIRIGL